jgi:hypothetical protein
MPPGNDSAPSTTGSAALAAAVVAHESAIHHAGHLLLKNLPHLGELAAVAVQAGVKLSPQAMLIATILQLLAAQAAPVQN